jgi:LPS export ABC transporter permease LptF/LPS export ABC transporter permease LptG
MRKLDRYLISEISGPLFLGFFGYTLILLMQFLFRSAEMIIRRGVPAEKVAALVGLSLPNIVVLTIPMSLLFAILVAVGRLAADSELTAMRASGVSLFNLYRPIAWLSLGVTGINTVLMLTALPWGNTRLQELSRKILTSSVARQIEPRVFYEEWEGLVVYVFEMPPGQTRWRGVVMVETRAGGPADTTFAEWGEARVDEESQRLILNLTNAEQHRVDALNPEDYQVFYHRSVERVLEALPEPQGRSYKSLRELTLGQLLQVLEEPNLSGARDRLARVEIHKKFSIPAACIVFALIALPLGFNQQKGGRASAFAFSIIIILTYYVILSNGEEAARVGRVAPWAAMWFPNLLFMAAGLFLLVRRNRDKSLLLWRIDHWLRDHFWELTDRLPLDRLRRRKTPTPPRVRPSASGTAAIKTRGVRAPDARGVDEVILKLPRLRTRCPNSLDRYIGRTFFKVLGLVVLSSVSIKLIADLTERVDDILHNEVPREVVFRYYRYLSLQAGYELAPVAVLIATMILFGLLSRSNEIIAAKALGISLYRLSFAALSAASLVAVGAAFLQAEVLPVTNEKVARINDRMHGRTVSRSYRRADRNWLFGQGKYIYNYLNYDAETQTLHQLQVLEFDDQHRLVRRMRAAQATYLGDDAWRFDDAWTRTFERTISGKPPPQIFRAASGPVVDRYPETPEYFESEFREPDAMKFGQLESYIRELEASGQAVPELRVELHNKLGYPVLCFVMALVALPFSFRLGKRGALYGMGVGVLLGMVFLGVYAFARTLGEAGALPPPLAIWSPSLAFAVLSIYMFLGVET